MNDEIEAYKNAGKGRAVKNLRLKDFRALHETAILGTLNTVDHAQAWMDELIRLYFRTVVASPVTVDEVGEIWFKLIRVTGNDPDAMNNLLNRLIHERKTE